MPRSVSFRLDYGGHTNAIKTGEMDVGCLSSHRCLDIADFVGCGSRWMAATPLPGLLLRACNVLLPRAREVLSHRPTLSHDRPILSDDCPILSHLLSAKARLLLCASASDLPSSASLLYNVLLVAQR